jgi:frataxin
LNINALPDRPAARMDTAFDSAANRFLTALTSAFEDALPAAEVDLEGGVLTVELEDGGTYVINKHAPTQQVWLSSPQSGAWHFVLDAGSEAWRDTRHGRDLLDLLAGELEAATGIAVSLAQDGNAHGR